MSIITKKTYRTIVCDVGGKERGEKDPKSPQRANK